MSDVDRDALREQIARALYESWRSTNPGHLTWETDARWRKDEFYARADAVIPSVSDALAAAEARADRAEAAIGRAIERKHFNQDCGWDVPLIELAEWDKEVDQ